MDQLKTKCKSTGQSAFCTYKLGTGHANAGKVCWKKWPHVVNETYLVPNPAVDGTWVRTNFPSDAPVEGYAWEFIPKMSLPGQGDVGSEPNWLFKYSIDNLKMIAAEQGMSAFVTYREGPLKNKVCWKKLPYQITKEHLKPNPACDGIWIRNLKPVGEVTTMNDGGDPDWEFVPEMSRAGQGDVGNEANWAQKYSIDQLK